MGRYSGTPKAGAAFKNVLYKKKGNTATVVINRPAVHNAIDFNTLRELGKAFELAAWDDEVAVVVITGAGTKAFCTGADIREWNDDFLQKPGDFYKWMGVFVETFERLRNIGKPTIARINGMAVGGGNELQMSCDLAVMADDTFIRHVGVARGSVPAAGATQWLPIMVGDRRAREILFLCEAVSPEKALDWGLVNRVVPRKDLDRTVEALADQLVNKLPESLRYTKQQLNFWRDFSWSMTIGHVRDWLTVHTGSEEVAEGIRAFNEKRPIDYAKLRAPKPPAPGSRASTPSAARPGRPKPSARGRRKR